MRNLLALIAQKNHPCQKSKKTTTFINPYSYLIARKNIRLFSGFDEIYCDGFALVLFLKMIGIKTTRLSFDMTSMAPEVFESASKNKSSILFVGGSDGVASAAALELLTEFPDLYVSGTLPGFFSSPQERDILVNKIVDLNPEFLICGMGAPHQEKFIMDLTELGWKNSGYTCGGFFHQTAKAGIKYYPDWINKYNLRWLYRMYDEPKLIKRYFFFYPVFVIYFIIDTIKYKFKFD